MTQNIPPKQTVNGAPGLANPLFEKGEAGDGGRDESGALVSIHNAALHANPDSFPVLKAFQDYLEAERQRARQRLVMLGAFFALLLIVVMLGLIGIGAYLFGNMSQTQSQLLAAVLDQRGKVAPEAAVTAAPLDTDTIAQAVEARVVAALAPPPASPHAEAVATTTLDATSTELARIREALAALQRENEELKTRPQLPPTVGPLVPRAAVAHLLDKPAQASRATATPPQEVARAMPPAGAPPKPASAPPRVITPPPPQTPTQPNVTTVEQSPTTAKRSDTAAPKAPAQPTLELAVGELAQTGRMILNVASPNNPGHVIPWRIVVPQSKQL